MLHDKADPSMHEQLARRLRHEVGDFLQKVYASVAILQRRLPPELAQERDILTRLRARAETCKDQLDAVQDFLCPMTLACEPTDLADMARRLTAAACHRFPLLNIRYDGQAALQAVVDPVRMAQVGEILVANACEAAHKVVVFQARQAATPDSVEWIISDDGPGVPAEHADQVFAPFFTTRAGHVGLGLTLARKIVDLHGGQVQGQNQATNGFAVQVVVPAQQPAHAT